MDKYIRMLLYKLKDKVKYSIRYMIEYEDHWETYFTKKELLNRLLEIERKG